MTLKTPVEGPAQLGELTARPYRRELASDASPVAVLNFRKMITLVLCGVTGSVAGS